MRPNGDDRGRLARRGVQIKTLNARFTNNLPRLNDRREEVLRPEVVAQPMKNLGIPVALLGIDEACRRRVRQLASRFSREPVRQQVGNQECRARTVRAPLPPVGYTLEQSIKRLELQSVVLIEPGGIPSVEHLGCANATARGTVGRRVTDQSAILVQQPVVHGPRVDSDSIYGTAQAGLAQALEDASPQREDVPLVGHLGLAPRLRSVGTTRPGNGDRPVREAGALLDGETFAVEHAPQDTPRGGPQVDSDDDRHHAPQEAC